MKQGGHIIALAGNPNVGKSTIFNSLTGLKQHTGNWAGKTVSTAQGSFLYEGERYVLTDLPGCYSLMAQSKEEEAARDFILSGKAELTVVVCDATCLERNLGLVLQTMELTDKTLLCVNLMDEAERKGVIPDIPLISKRLGIPVIGISARSKDGTKALLPYIKKGVRCPASPIRPDYPDYITAAMDKLAGTMQDNVCRYRVLHLLEGEDIPCSAEEKYAAECIRKELTIEGYPFERIQCDIASAYTNTAKRICSGALHHRGEYLRDRRVDSIITSKALGFPIMLLLLALVFYITIWGANYPSRLLSELFFRIQDKLLGICRSSPLPPWLYEMLILGVYRVSAWVIAVMLPPMAIFFPLFTLLEDLGYLPRVAFNLDRCFKGCRACGKQALTTMMGFGCNAVGIEGCRIIDSPRERLIAILTNCFVPCNGRFPTLIAIISIFFAAGEGSIASALLLTLLIVFAIFMTFAGSKLLSMTLLKGVPSSFTLELPPYRPPEIIKVIGRSIIDRTAFVLGRAVSAAAPAGLIIWLMANVRLCGASLLSHCAAFLDPLGQLMGLDGIILIAFILGFPANEIVLPIMLMGYTSQGTITDYSGLMELRALLAANGWDISTAICMLLFTLMHWPCATACNTIKKETGSLKWTALAAAFPTACGMALCVLVNLILG